MAREKRKSYSCADPRHEPLEVTRTEEQCEPFRFGERVREVVFPEIRSLLTAADKAYGSARRVSGGAI